MCARPVVLNELEGIITSLVKKKEKEKGSKMRNPVYRLCNAY